MKFITKNRTFWLLAATLLGCLVLVGGANLAVTRSAQADYYNLGLKAYQDGDMAKAAQYFDRSYSAYRQETKAGWLHRFIYPKPSRELAAQANFQKAKALLQNKQAEPAVDAFKESLKLNPGDQYEGLSPEDAERLHEEALVVKYDLELLFKAQPQLAQQQGKGQGKGKGDKQGKPQQGNDPSNAAGKGNRDDI